MHKSQMMTMLLAPYKLQITISTLIQNIEYMYINYIINVHIQRKKNKILNFGGIIFIQIHSYN